MFMPERLSLCIIAGNESSHIGRLLDSFNAGFDELSFVRAVGATPPDDTWAQAEAWCASHGKDFIGREYVNGAENTAWKHVDDFAAARNAAFAQAMGDWLFWADCDDVIDDAGKIRDLAASGRCDMYRLPYWVPDARKLTTRERLIKADLFKRGRIWRWAVHENLLIFGDDKWENVTAPVYTHVPKGPKAGGDKRNLRILTSTLRDAPTNYFYCHQEHFYLRNKEQSRRFGELFLELPLRSPVLEYQCLLNLSELCESKNKATLHALRAHQLYPKQKEALACLVKCSLQEENADAAAHWSKLLVEAPTLSAGERLWCYEPKWDGWAGWDLRARALRYVGEQDEAKVAQSLVHADGVIEFSLLHATRGRINMAIGAREIWMELADNPAAVEHIFAIDDDDAESCRWLKSFAHVVSPKRTCVDAWNRAAVASSGRVLIQVSDDWIPPRGWDTKLRAIYTGRDPLNEDFVLAVNDGHRTDELLCMAILSRARWQTQGEMFSPDYESVFSDNHFTYHAYKDGVVINARHLTFEHHHPAHGKGRMDDTYRRQNAPEKYRRGLETFKRLNPGVHV
jgi:hypothetical protein